MSYALYYDLFTGSVLSFTFFYVLLE